MVFRKHLRPYLGQGGSYFRTCVLLAMGPAILAGRVALADPLPSGNEASARQVIIEFVRRVTDKSSPQYVPPEQRIATFDNDGTLWSEQPMYFQAFFTLDRVKALAPQHPEWKDRQPFKAILENDTKALVASGEKGVLEILMASHAGVTTEEFEGIVRDWLATAKHPRFNRPFTDLVFQPMLALLADLPGNGFKR